MNRRWKMLNYRSIIKKKNIVLLTSLFLLSSLLAFLIYRNISTVKASDETWVQTDWRLGVLSELVDNDEEVLTFLEEENIDNLNVGELSLEETENWELANWGYRRKVLFDNTTDNIGVEPEALVNFPILVKLDDGVNIDYSKTSNDGSDIRFVDTDGTELSYEIEDWDETADSYVWVKVPQIDIGDQDYIYIYYGNSTATDNQNSSDVWSNGYNIVFHNDDNTTATILESVTGAIAGKGVVNEPLEVSGLLSKAQSFDGINDYITLTDNLIVNPSTLTIESWFKKESGGSTYECVLHRASGTTIGASEYWMGVDISDNLTATIGANTGAQWSAGQTTTTAIYGDWYYLVATWDGSVVKVYINGQYNKQYNLTSYNNLATPTRIGASSDGSNYQFRGDVDEAYVSQAHRSDAWIAASYKGGLNEFISFQDEESRYPAEGYVISNIFDTGYPSDWGILSYTSTDNIEVRVRTSQLSDMSDGESWTNCLPIESGSDLTENDCVIDEDRYLQYKIDFESLVTSATTFEEIQIGYSPSDQTDPMLNATDFDFSEPLLEDEQWINFKPKIIWDPGQDNPGGNGLLGYYISLTEVDVLGDPGSPEPNSSSGVLSGIDDGIDSNNLTYIVTDEEVDFSQISELTLQSNKQYYFSIQAVDLAGNYWKENTAGYQNLISFKYDNTKPQNVMYISTPSSTFGSINDMFFNWPIDAPAAAVDNESGILGWQYAINSTAAHRWMGLEGGTNYIPLGSGQIMLFNEDLHDTYITEGNNTIYFRAIDNAGNVSTYVTGGINFGGEAPTFPAESGVTVTPQTSESNSFALSWPEAIPGEEKEISSYYYMINTQPPDDIETLKGNSTIYIPTTNTSVSQDVLVGAVKGSNNVYVVAVDDDDNYSPSNMVAGTFVLDSNLPDPPQNLSVSDTSIKEAEIWRVALTWDPPEYKGNGNISYIIEKSLDGLTWTELDRITGNAYSDTSESSREYYYKVGTIDTSDESKNSPSYASALSINPKGRFTTPPTLVSRPVVTEISTRSAKVTWVTDRNSDSKLQYGVSSGEYFDSEISTSTQATEHTLDMNNLLPGMVYYVRAKWTDEDGNTGSSDEFYVETKPAPRVEDVYISTVGLDYAILNITTVGAINANVLYGKTKSYGGSQEINTSTAESEYSVMLTQLEDGTEYHYTIILTDEEGYQYDGFGDLVFSTPPRPQVSNIQIQEKKGVPTPTIEVFWESNIAVSSIVKYSSNGKSLDKVDMELIEGEHSMEIEGLDSNSEYQLTVEGVDGMGNRAVSDVYAFTTATDTRPPKVSGIRSEGDIQSSDIQSDRSRSAQLIISWQTDEPSTSQILYGEGAASDGFPYSTQTDSQMRYEHVLIVSNLSPSKVYHFKVVSKDSAGNVGESGSVTSITPKSTDTVMESVLGSLGRIFNFL
jgi:hypothetical protein